MIETLLVDGGMTAVILFALHDLRKRMVAVEWILYRGQP